MKSLLDHIDRPTFEAAVRRLGTTPQDFFTLSGAEIAALIERYLKECADYVARVRARDDQVQAAGRLIESVPDDCRGVPLYELTKRGLLDADEFRDAMQTIVRVQAEEEDDLNPADDNVTALLDALGAVFS